MVVRGTPRVAISARLITGRPLMAGMRTTSSVRPHPLTWPGGIASTSAEADLGILIWERSSLCSGRSNHLESVHALRRLMPSLVGVLERRGARRPCGTFAEALLAVPPSGAGPSAAAS